MKVCDLIAQPRQYNDNLFRDLFFKEEAYLVLSIPLSPTGMEDRLICHYDRFGKYWTRSGYHVARTFGVRLNGGNKVEEGTSSAQNQLTNIWKAAIQIKSRFSCGECGQTLCLLR